MPPFHLHFDAGLVRNAGFTASRKLGSALQRTGWFLKAVRMKPAICVFLAAFSTGVCAQELGAQLKALGFTEQVRKQPGDSGAAYVRLPFYGVSLRANKLSIRPERRVPNGLVKTMQGKDFSYIGKDKGEWGGELVAIDRSGKKFEMSKANVTGLFKIDGKIYVATGLAHLSFNDGALYRIDEDQKEPRLTLVTLLTAAPVDVVVENKVAYILTYGDLESVDFRSDRPSLRMIVHGGTWEFSPSNLVKLGPQFAVGMQGGVVVVEYDEMRRTTVSRYFAK